MDNGAIGFFLFFVILIIIWIFAMGGCVRERKSFGVYEGLDTDTETDTNTIKFSTLYPNPNLGANQILILGCRNRTISPMPADITAHKFNSNEKAKQYGAKMETCKKRNFNKKGKTYEPKKVKYQGYTVKWDGQEWLKEE